MAGGYVKIHRSLWSSPHFKEEPFTEREAWMWMVSEAAWKDTSTRGHGGVIDLRRGQFTHSIRFMAEKWGWHRNKVDRFLKRLEIETVIGTTNACGQKVITICNYEEYQDGEAAKETVGGTTDGTTAGQYRDNTGTEKEETKKLRSLRSYKEAKASSSKTADKSNGFDPFAFVEVWNSVCGQAGLATVRVLKDQRKRKAFKRWREDFGANVDSWRLYCGRIAASDILSGRKGRDWRATFDWVIEPRNLVRIIEGQYDNRGQDPPGQPSLPPVDLSDRKAVEEMKQRAFEKFNESSNQPAS